MSERELIELEQAARLIINVLERRRVRGEDVAERRKEIRFVDAAKERANRTTDNKVK